MNSKDIILRIIKLKPEITTYRVAKLAYIFDLASVQLSGNTKTGLPFYWGLYGPYCREIEESLWVLVDEGKISKENLHIEKKDWDCTIHEAKTNENPPLNELEEKLLEYILKKYSNMRHDDLDEFIYATPPMKKAQKGEVRFKLLDLQSTEGVPKIFYDPSVAKQILESTVEGPKHKRVSFEEAWKKLEEKCSA